jgi:hypothetical protein
MKITQALHQRLRQARRRRFRPRLAELGVKFCPPAAAPSCCAKPACRHRGLRLHRLPRNARRPRQDPAPQGAWRHPRHPRQRRARGDHAAARHPADRPGGGEPLPFARRWRRRTARWKTPSRTSTSAARPWCARRRRTTATNSRRRRHRHRPRGLRCHRRGTEGQRRRALLPTRFALAKKAFTHTARYDAAIANWLTSLDAENKPGAFPERLQLAFDKVDTLRYGENPHQQAAFYRETAAVPGSIANYEQTAGQGALLQQHRRRRCGLGVRQGLRSPRASPASSSSTPTPAASPSRRRRWMAYQKGLQDRPDLGLRRHHRLQLRHRQSDGRGRLRPVRRGDHRPGDHRRRARRLRRQAEPARAGRPPRGAPRTSSTTSASAAACWCRRPTWRASPNPTSRW